MVLGAAAAGAGVVLTGCSSEKKAAPKADAKGGADKKPAAPKKKALKCDDVSALSDAEKNTRNTFKYVAKSTDPAKNCLNCQLYQSKGADACGGCQVVKGPIHPAGYCTAWVKKA